MDIEEQELENEDEEYFTKEEQELYWKIISDKSESTGININDYI
jgi:hypothetical protein